MQKICTQTIRFFHQWALYGFRVAFWTYFSFFTHKLKKVGLFVLQRKHKSILCYLSRHYKNIIGRYQNEASKTEAELLIDAASPIWVCWWDGYNGMPPIAKICYNSLLRHLGGHPVKLVTKDNYKNFVSLPDHIMEKFAKGIISIAHFSDILRVTLLYEHGGIWIDATILVLNDIPLMNAPFFSLKPLSTKIDYISHVYWRELTSPETRKKFNHDQNIGCWTAYLLAGSKKSILFDFIREFFYTYWNQHDDLIDYFLIDYTIALAYDNITTVKEMIDNIFIYEAQRADTHALEKIINTQFSEKEFLQYSITPFHKMSWKKNYSFLTKEGKLTMYGHLLQEYG